MKKERFFLFAVIRFIRSAPTRIMNIPTKYIKVPTQADLPKNEPAKRDITGSFAPQGIKGVSIAVARLSLSSLIVLHAIIPGMEQPVPITKGMIFPNKHVNTCFIF